MLTLADGSWAEPTGGGPMRKASVSPTMIGRTDAGDPGVDIPGGQCRNSRTTVGREKHANLGNWMLLVPKRVYVTLVSYVRLLPFG